MTKHTLIYDDDTVLHRLKSHIIEVGVGALGFVVGGMVFAGAILDPGTYAASALAALPTAAVLALGVVHMFAGLLVLAGLLIARRDVAVEIHTEQFGWILAAAGWYGFGWCIWYFAAGASVGVAFGVILGTAAALRSRYLDEVEAQARARLARGPGVIT